MVKPFCSPHTLHTFSVRLAASLRILIYSGDVDGIVPVVGTRRWTAGLGLKTTKPWRPWFSATQQVRPGLPAACQVLN